MPPSVGAIESLDMVLIIPIASEYFYDYLDKQSEDPDAPIFFSLYADLRYYDKACNSGLGDDTGMGGGAMSTSRGGGDE